MEHSSQLRTPIKRARGLGSAHTGTHHFWLQRVSAVALIPLSVWFVTSLVSHLLGSSATTLQGWLSSPLNALAMAAFVVALFTHARLGVQVIIEDYVHCGTKKLVFLLLLNMCILGFGAASLLAILKLHFFGM